MPTRPDRFLALARTAADGPGEEHWRMAMRCSFDAVFHLIAGVTELDPATFAGNTRAVREALFALDPAVSPKFVAQARRHWNTLWLASLRAERSLDEAVTADDARLSVALASGVLAEWTARLQ